MNLLKKLIECVISPSTEDPKTMGQSAYFAGSAEASNPFPKGSKDHDLWDEGYCGRKPLRTRSANVSIELLVIMGIMLLILIVCLWMWLHPKYRVYSQTMEGTAELRRAEQNRQIKIEEAKAENEAATSQAQARVKIAEALSEAEIIRARGAAEANKIIGESLKENEAYLRYLWIQGLNDGKGERIYIPTEAGLPILEAK